MLFRLRLRAIILAVPVALAATTSLAADTTPGQSGISSTMVVEPTPRVILVQGQGTVEAIPDIADIVTGVVTREKTARAAINANSVAMERLLSALRGAGIAEKDIRTSGFSLSPWYEPAQRNQPREIAGYQASNQVTVTMRDLKRVGEVLDKVITAGSNKVNGIRFKVSNANVLMDKARRKAVAEAKRRAGLFASAAGVELGRVLRLQEGGVRPPPPRMLSSATMAEARSVPIAPGTQEITATVSVQYELK